MSFYTQNGWMGSKYKPGMRMADISKAIKQELKKEFPGCVFSVQINGGSIRISLMAGSFEAILFKTDMDKEKIPCDKQHCQLNDYTLLEPSNDYYSNGAYLSAECWKTMKRAVEIVKSYNYSDCDPMIDYFNVNFYPHFNIGKWDKPYSKSEKKELSASVNSNDIGAGININKEKNGIEIRFSRWPAEEILKEMKENKWRWSSFNKCWYKTFSEADHLFAKAIIQLI